MAKKILFVVLAIAFVAACSKGISKEQYISAMTELGCKHATEFTPQGKEILKTKGVTLDQVNAFRKNMKPDDTMQIAQEIAKRVMACHGLNKPMQSAKPEASRPD